jgi:tripartite-type tricarboxylate transporter receptor subunit TctC
VAKLSAAIADVVHMLEVEKRLRDLAAIPVGNSPAQARARIEEERERWHRIIVSAGIKAQ